ncbi:MAG: hypothetical protein WCI92_00590 [Bacteroidota bacterium]
MNSDYERQSKEIRTIYINGELFHNFRIAAAIESKKASVKIEELIQSYMNSRPSIQKILLNQKNSEK